jgi:hypothetical protein
MLQLQERIFRHNIAEESTLLGHKAKPIVLPDHEYEGVNILRTMDNSLPVEKSGNPERFRSLVFT